jgi:hypothetical protein
MYMDYIFILEVKGASRIVSEEPTNISLVKVMLWFPADCPLFHPMVCNFIIDELVNIKYLLALGVPSK